MRISGQCASWAVVHVCTLVLLPASTFAAGGSLPQEPSHLFLSHPYPLFTLQAKLWAAQDVVSALRHLQERRRMTVSVMAAVLALLQEPRVVGGGADIEQGNSEGQLLYLARVQFQLERLAAAEGTEKPRAMLSQQLRQLGGKLKLLGQLPLRDLMRVHAYVCLHLAWQFPLVADFVHHPQVSSGHSSAGGRAQQWLLQWRSCSSAREGAASPGSPCCSRQSHCPGLCIDCMHRRDEARCRRGLAAARLCCMLLLTPYHCYSQDALCVEEGDHMPCELTKGDMLRIPPSGIKWMAQQKCTGAVRAPILGLL